MRDLIRNYKLILKRKNETDSENEAQPLTSSSSSSTKNNFGSFSEQCIFKHDSDSDNVTTYAERDQCPPEVVPPKKSHRQLLIRPPSYEPDLDGYEIIHDIPEHNNSCRALTSDKIFQENGTRRGGNLTYDALPEVMETNNSVVTIFAIWNTTVGTSLLAMSWGIEKTGLFPAVLINIAIAAICLYTTSTLLKINEKHGMPGVGEVCDLCKALLGRWAEVLAKFFSIVVLIGANIVYWILMSNFLYNSVNFMYGLFVDIPSANISNEGLSVERQGVICPRNESLLHLDIGNSTLSNSTTSAFQKFWDLYSTVPVILALVMFPLLNWRSPTFFTKFNSLGTLSVLYLMVFVAAKASVWGININSWAMEFQIKPTFCALSGMLSLSYFIHNIIISVMRNNKYQEHNGRDLAIAFGLITFTYLFIGALFYISFPLPKFCIEDNILNNFDHFDVLTIIARVLLLFQLFTVFPLISYMLRNNILVNINLIFKNHRFGDFTYWRVMVINIGILIICILFACFLPRIGTLIRYTGALSGLVYIFMLPNLLKLASLRKENALTATRLIFHVTIIVGGFLNLVSQFLISDK